MSKKQAGVHEWARELAPSTELRKWFAHRPERFEEFRRRYKEELRTHERRIDGLRTRSRDEPVTLLFGARDTERNNAVVLAEVVGEAR